MHVKIVAIRTHEVRMNLVVICIRELHMIISAIRIREVRMNISAICIREVHADTVAIRIRGERVDVPPEFDPDFYLGGWLDSKV